VVLKVSDLCDLCNGNAAAPILELPPHTIVRCTVCGLVYVIPRPTPAELAALYDEAYFRGTGPVGYRPDEDYIGNDSRLELFIERTAAVERYRRPPGVLVDVGCATGFALRAARDRGWDCLGIDVSEFAVNFAREHYGLNVVKGTLREAAIPSESVDALTMWDLLEHVPSPRQECVEANRVLKPGGVLALATPDADCPCPSPETCDPAKAAFWQAKPPEHIHYFSPATISRLLAETGFYVVNLTSYGPGDCRLGAMEVYALKVRALPGQKDER